MYILLLISLFCTIINASEIVQASYYKKEPIITTHVVEINKKAIPALTETAFVGEDPAKNADGVKRRNKAEKVKENYTTGDEKFVIQIDNCNYSIDAQKTTGPLYLSLQKKAEAFQDNKFNLSSNPLEPKVYIKTNDIKKDDQISSDDFIARLNQGSYERYDTPEYIDSFKIRYPSRSLQKKNLDDSYFNLFVGFIDTDIFLQTKMDWFWKSDSVPLYNFHIMVGSQASDVYPTHIMAKNVHQPGLYDQIKTVFTQQELFFTDPVNNKTVFSSSLMGVLKYMLENMIFKTDKFQLYAPPHFTVTKDKDNSEYQIGIYGYNYSYKTADNVVGESKNIYYPTLKMTISELGIIITETTNNNERSQLDFIPILKYPVVLERFKKTVSEVLAGENREAITQLSSRLDTILKNQGLNVRWNQPLASSIISTLRLNGIRFNKDVALGYLAGWLSALMVGGLAYLYTKFKH